MSGIQAKYQNPRKSVIISQYSSKYTTSSRIFFIAFFRIFLPKYRNINYEINGFQTCHYRIIQNISIFQEISRNITKYHDISWFPDGPLTLYLYCHFQQNLYILTVGQIRLDSNRPIKILRNVANCAPFLAAVEDEASEILETPRLQ